MNEEPIINSIREELIFKLEIQQYLPSFRTMKFSERDSFESWDISGYTNHESYNVVYSTIGEIKVRNYSIKSYYNWKIEKHKYDFLTQTNFDRIYYINIYPDGFQVWNLKKLTEPIWREEVERSNNYDDTTRIKSVGYLYDWDVCYRIEKQIDIENYNKLSIEYYNTKINNKTNENN